MTWLQENWIIAVVGLVVAVVLLWWLFGRSKPEEIAPTVEPAKPAKPLEPVKPEIIAAEPARFKPIEPKAPSVAPEPVAKAAPPALAPKPAPVAEAAPPAPKPAAKPKAAAKPAAKKTAVKEPAAKPVTKPATKAAAKPAAKKAAKPAPAMAAAVIPEEPTVPPPPAAKPAPAPSKTGPDNLQLLKGVGPKLAVLLSGLGVTSFRQIADWTDADIARIDPQLGTFQGRIARDNIVDQAGYLARGDKAGFEAKYGALGGEF
jgi:predicted flap endonuclease-1-like 5' DNA nuclease